MVLRAEQSLETFPSSFKGGHSEVASQPHPWQYQEVEKYMWEGEMEE